MTTETFAILLFTAALGCAASYGAGYYTGLGNSRVLAQRAKAELKLAQSQRLEIGAWINENWPDEHTAYHRGVDEGYQQGINHAATLAADAEAREQ